VMRSIPARSQNNGLRYRNADRQVMEMQTDGRHDAREYGWVMAL
jgi:hypothetical protein